MPKWMENNFEKYNDIDQKKKKSTNPKHDRFMKKTIFGNSPST